MPVCIGYYSIYVKGKIALFSYIVEIVSIQQERVFKRANYLREKEERRTRKEDREHVPDRTASQRTLGHKLSWVKHYNKSFEIILRKKQFSLVFSFLIPEHFYEAKYPSGLCNNKLVLFACH